MAKAKAKSAAAPSVPAPTGGKYERTKVLTVPVLKVVEEQPIYIKATAPMFVGKQVANAKGDDGQPQKPADILPVINVETGEAMQVIVGAALKGLLNDQYPNDGYVGKAFEVIKHAKPPGKRYHNYSVYEIAA